MKSALAAGIVVIAASFPAQAADLPIPIVAAENFYGAVASAIGGDRVAVESIVVSAKADPHDFEPSASVARAVADARIVIMNGAGYDHWMERLIDSSGGSGRKIVDVATLIGATEAGNPHLWYDPRAVPALAANLAEALSAIDPDGKDEYWSRSQDFFASLRELDEKIKTIRAGYAGTPVTATEPVFGLMARALGLDMRDTDFQRAIMNESEPSAHQLGELENDIRSHRVKVLFYNSQVVDPMTEHLLAVAGDARLPVVGVTEIMPEGADYVGWMLDQLEATEKALAAPSS